MLLETGETRARTLANQTHHPKDSHPQGGVGSSKALLVHKGLEDMKKAV